MNKLQKTDKVSKNQKNTLSEYFNDNGLKKKGQTSLKEWYRLRDLYNFNIKQIKSMKSYYKTSKGKIDIKQAIGINKVIHTDRNFKIHPDNSGDQNMKHLIKQYKGQIIRVITSINNIVFQDLELDVPLHGFSNFWDTVFWYFYYDSDTTIIKHNCDLLTTDNVKIIFNTGSKLTANYLNQSFRDGINHCVLYPILKWANDLLSHNIFEKRKAGISRYSTIVKKIKIYEILYQKGVPEEKLQEISNNLQINISVDLPLSKTKYLSFISDKKPLKKFNFINTRINHLNCINEVVNTNNIESYEIKELELIVKKFDNEINSGEAYYKKDTNNRITTLYTLDKTYKAFNNYINAVLEFERSTGLDQVNIEYFKNQDLSIFIRDGSHFNETVDFNNSIEITDIKHQDMIKAYIQFKKCPYYKGFLGKITDFRNCDNVDINFIDKNIGLYRVDNFNFSCLNENSYKIIMKLNCYKNNNIYPSSELIALNKLGITFNILEGCWGSVLDFEFNEEMINNEDIISKNGREKKVKYYAKYIGSCFSLNKYNKFYMKGTKEYFQNMLNILKKDNISVDINMFNEDEAVISYPRKCIMHKSHIASFVTSYQRLTMIDQLLSMDYNDIRRICVDGIYYRGDYNFTETFQKKIEIKLENSASDNYCSNIFDLDKKSFDYDKKLKLTNNPFRKSYKTELFLGAGGNGKTHLNLTDKGLVNILFVAPSWELATEKKKEYNVDSTVIYRALDNVADENNAKNFIKRYNTIIFDEASMITEEQRKIIFTIYSNCKIIFCGDIGYQLPPISGCVMKSNNFENIQILDKNFRFKCDKHIQIITQVRNLIKSNTDINIINKYIFDNYTKIKFENIKDYSVEDIILCSRTRCNVEGHKSSCNCNGKNFSSEWNLKFGDTKFKCLERGNGLFNGSIVYEKPYNIKYEIRHGFTIHSVQGKTYKNKIYIDSRNLFSSTMGYTAISRAEYWDQIIIVY
jgi:hypothetical protein